MFLWNSPPLSWLKCSPLGSHLFLTHFYDAPCAFFNTSVMTGLSFMRCHLCFLWLSPFQCIRVWPLAWFTVTLCLLFYYGGESLGLLPPGINQSRSSWVPHVIWCARVSLMYACLYPSRACQLRDILIQDYCILTVVKAAVTDCVFTVRGFHLCHFEC